MAKMKVAQVSKAKGDFEFAEHGRFPLRDQDRFASRCKPAAFATAMCSPKKVGGRVRNIRALRAMKLPESLMKSVPE
jgi:hypothetical protein